MELSTPPRSLTVPTTPSGSDYRRARILVRLQGEPLGNLHVELSGDKLDGAVVMERVRRDFADDLAERLGADWRDSLGAPLAPLSDELAALDGPDLPSVSVVIGTRNRPDHAMVCVDRVLKQAYGGSFEVVVVDNAPSNDATRDAIADRYGHDCRVRYLLEAEQGLSRARNTGLAAARHEITAFLSDDIQVDQLWLRALARGFSRHVDVDCVVGYCPPLFLDTEEQIGFEKLMAWGWRGGFRPVLLSLSKRGDRVHPYRFGLGTGANMSFRTDRFRLAGGFDPTLGPGTPARGGEDLDAPVRVLLSGGRVAYEPAAIGWHADRFDDRDFATHLYTYGLGLTAFLASHLIDPSTRRGLLRRAPFGCLHLPRPALLPDGDHGLDHIPASRRHALVNIAGRLAGPIALLRSRRAATTIEKLRTPIVAACSKSTVSDETTTGATTHRPERELSR